MSGEPVVVVAAEVCTSLGFDLATTALEIEAGTNRMEDTPVLDQGDEPARAARLTVLPPGNGRARRMAALGVTALRPLVETMLRAGLERVALYLGVPCEEDLPAAEVSRVLSALRSAVAPMQLTLPRKGTYAAGRASAFLALEGAMQEIGKGAIDGAIVGAVDCLCDTGSLVTLIARRELLGPANIEGRLTGEGAGFVWLASERLPLPRELVPARVLGVATGHEPRRPGHPQPNLGEGLTVVMRSLRHDDHAGRPKVDHLLSCQTDQGHWNTELSWAYLRNAALFPEPFEPQHLPASLADTGAAAGAIALALATRAAGLEPLGRRTLVYGGSDTGELGACVVSSGEPVPWGPPRVEVELTGGLPSLREHERAPPFLHDLQHVHLEEIGILLDLRGSIMRDPLLGWLQVADVESRIEAHRRAWAHGAARSRELAEEALGGDDPERTAGAVLTLAGDDEAEDLRAVALGLVAVDPDEHPRWCDALAWGARPSPVAIASFGVLLDASEPEAVMLGLRVFDAWCRCETPRVLGLLDGFEPGTPEHDAALLHVARWGDRPREVEARLQGLPMRAQVVEAALWLGQRAPLLALRMRLQQGQTIDPELLPYLATLGEAEDAGLVEGGLGSSAEADVAAHRALGRIGLARTVPGLLESLSEAADDEVRAGAIADALEQICGAHLREEFLAAPEDDPEDPDDPDDDPTPEPLERTCLDPERWAAWWREHGGRFVPGRCYRRGRPADALALVHELLDPGLGLGPRRDALLDLFVRTGRRLRLDPTWPVAHQLPVLHGLRSQLEQEDSR